MVVRLAKISKIDKKSTNLKFEFFVKIWKFIYG